MDTDLVTPPPRTPNWSDGPPIAWVHYDEEGDRLRIGFVAEPRPGYNHPIDDYACWRIDLATDEIIGYEVERFAARAVIQRPELLPLLELINASDRQIKRARSRLTPEQRQAAARRAARHLLPLPAFA